MNLRKVKKLLRSDNYIAEVEVEVEDDPEFGPTLSMQDVKKLSEVQRLLDIGDVQKAASVAAVFAITPVRVA